MNEKITLILDAREEGEYMYKREDESYAEYRSRMEVLRKMVAAQATEEEEQLAREILQSAKVTA